MQQVVAFGYICVWACWRETLMSLSVCLYLVQNSSEMRIVVVLLFCIWSKTVMLHMYSFIEVLL